MGYNETGHIIDSKPVGIGDIKKALHSRKKDIGGLATSPLVNKWAKYKPVDITGPEKAIESGTNYQGASRSGLKTCGLDISPVSTISLALSKAKSGSDWRYTHRPTDAMGYRNNDFLGYYHDAKSFMKSFGFNMQGISASEIPIGEGNISFSVVVETAASTKELRETDLLVAPNNSSKTTLNKWNKGLLLEQTKQEGNDLWKDVGPFITDTLTIDGAMTSIMAMGGYRTSRTFMAYPVYVMNPISKTVAGGSQVNHIDDTDSQASNLIIPMDLPPVEVRVVPALGQVVLQGMEYNKDSHDYSIQVSVINQRNDTMALRFSSTGGTVTYGFTVYGYTNAANADADYRALSFTRANYTFNTADDGHFTTSSPYYDAGTGKTTIPARDSAYFMYTDKIFTGVTGLVALITVCWVKYETSAGETRTTNTYVDYQPLE